MTDINKLKQILDNAPEGATHYVNNEYCYRKETEEDFYLWANERWVLSSQVYFYTNSLSDLRTIVEQADRFKELKNQIKRVLGFQEESESIIEKECAENQALKVKIAELEKEVADHKANIDHLMNNCHRFTDKRLQEHNLEQQAKGLEDYAKESCVGIDGVWMIAKASKLREQAKQLGGDL